MTFFQTLRMERRPLALLDRQPRPRHLRVPVLGRRPDRLLRVLRRRLLRRAVVRHGRLARRAKPHVLRGEGVAARAHARVRQALPAAVDRGEHELDARRPHRVRFDGGRGGAVELPVPALACILRFSLSRSLGFFRMKVASCSIRSGNVSWMWSSSSWMTLYILTPCLLFVLTLCLSCSHSPTVFLSITYPSTCLTILLVMTVLI